MCPAEKFQIKFPEFRLGMNVARSDFLIPQTAPCFLAPAGNECRQSRHWRRVQPHIFAAKDLRVCCGRYAGTDHPEFKDRNDIWKRVTLGSPMFRHNKGGNNDHGCPCSVRAAGCRYGKVAGFDDLAACQIDLFALLPCGLGIKRDVEDGRKHGGCEVFGILTALV